jgi:hypothetical protein
MKIYILMVIAGLLILAGLTIDKLSSDAVGMALGVIFGVLAGLPAAMVMCVAGRRRQEWDEPGRTIIVVQQPPVNLVGARQTNALESVLIDDDYIEGVMMPLQITERECHE